MATGKSFNLDFSGGSGFTFRVNLAETYDSVNNKSSLTVTSAQFMSSSWTGANLYPSGTITVDDQVVPAISGNTGATFNNASPASHYCPITWTGAYYDVLKYSGGNTAPWAVPNAITHNSDGSKNVTVAVNLSVSLYQSGSKKTTFSVSGSKSIALTTIARASTISATDANIESTSMLAVNRRSSAFTHTIHYAFGEASGYVNADGNISDSAVQLSATSIGFNIPASFYQQIPSAKSGTCTLTITTYSGNTQVGNPQTATFTITAAQALCSPEVSGTVVDSNEETIALTGDANVLVRFFSNAYCTIAANARNAASIVSKSIAGTAVEENAHTIIGVENNVFTFSATDSRGYSGSITVTNEMVPYIKLTNNAFGKRTDPTSGNAILTLKGDYYNGSFGNANNTLTAKYRINSGNWIDVTGSLAIADNSYTATVNLTGLDYSQSYALEVVVSDALNASVLQKITINKGIPIADWGENDYRVNVLLKAIASAAITGNLTVSGNTTIGGSASVGSLTVGGNSLLNLVYPVGSVYMSLNSTSPASLFGGTWTQITNRFLLAAGSSYSAGSTGGASTVTLTTSQIPSHSHGLLVDKSGYTGGGNAGAKLSWGTGYTSYDTAAIAYTGGGGSHNNMPPYYAVYMWRRTA